MMRLRIGQAALAAGKEGVLFSSINNAAKRSTNAVKQPFVIFGEPRHCVEL